MILQADYIRSRKSKYFISLICFALITSSAFAQTGVVNNGAKMIINTGAVLKITGTGADYTNTTAGGRDGRIDLDGKIVIEGDWTNNAATGNVMINFNTLGDVLFIGSSQQNILGSTATTFENLTIDNTSGLNLSNDVTVRKVSTLANGNVFLNSNHFTVGSDGSLSGTFGTTKMFVVNGTGTLKKAISGTGSFTFPIGEISGTIEYCPVDFNLIAHSGLTNAFLSARVVNSKHVNNTSPSEFLSRYWTLTKSGTFNVTNSSLVFHYQDADVTGTEADIYAAQYNGVTRNVYSKVTAGSNIFTINGLTAYADFTGVDGTVPTATISTTESNPTNSSPTIPFTVAFSEEVTEFTFDDITIDNGSTSAVSTSDNTTFDFDVTPSLNGDVTIDINSAAAKDIAGNDNTAAETYVIEFDNTNPTIAITSSEPDPTNTAVDFNLTFSEVVTGFASEDITVGNGSVTSFLEQTTGLVWNVTVTPTTDGLVTLNIGSGLASDAAGNGNDAAAEFSRTFDDNAPSVVISSLESILTNANPIPITITFNESVIGFALNDILSNGTVGNLVNTTPGLVWTAQVTPAGDGEVTVDINADMAQDAATNGNTAATQFSIDYDGTKPSVSITSVETNPTNSSFDVSIYFDEIVSDFVVGDVTVGNGTKGTFTPIGNDQDWTLQINPTSDGLVTVNIAADIATDDAGNGNSAATTYSITFDGTNPSVSGFNPSDDETSVSITSNLEITFNEIVNAVSGNISLIETGVGTVEIFDVTTDITGDGTSTISVNPASNLSSATAYHVLIDATAFDDDAGNAYAGIADQTTWNFTSSDVNNPYIIAKSPSDNAVDVSLTTDLEITFSEDIKANSGYIRLYNSSDVQVKAFDVTSEISIVNDVISIDLSSVTLIGETAYYILIDNNAIQDLTSNPFAGISSKLTWNFATEDVTGPTVSVLSPIDGAVNVLISSDLEITFNENVEKGSGNIIITNATLASQHESIDVTIGQVTISSNVVTINPGTNFDGESDYYIEMAAGVFTDASSNTNNFDGISGSSTWNFTTEDKSSPTVVVSTSELSPTNSSLFIVTITFNEVMTGFVNGNISVTNGTAANLNTSDNKVFTVEITPSSEGDVSVIVPAGMATDASGNGNVVSNEITIEYDSTSPTVEITSLESGIIASDFDVTITFNEEITDLILGNITVGNGTASNLINQVSGTEWNVTITPTSDGTVTVEVLNDVVTDIAGNGNNASDQFSIEYDGSGPEISSLNPFNGENNVAVNSNLQITFDELVYKNIGNIKIYYQSNDVLFESVNVNDVAGDGTTTITIDPVTDFDGETTYYVLIDAEAFIDGLGNGFTGISSGSDWIFTTKDIVAPTVDVLTPNGVSNVLVNANLEITFSEDVTKNVGIITIMNDDTGEEHEQIDVETGPITVIGNVATIVPSILFIGETNYYVLVGESTFQDLSGNNFAGISSTTDWTFYTEDIEPPVINTKSPSDNAENIAISANLIITFSENVVAGSGNIVIMNESGPTVQETIPIGAENVSISGNEITINPATDFDGLSNYYVLIDPTAIDDAFGNSFAGITDPAVWNFTTVDASAPAVSDFVPADNSTGITSNPNLVITFNEDVNAISGKFITIMNSTTGLTHETIDAVSASVDVTANIVTIDPSINFDDLSNYYVLIEYGAFQDIDANSYSGITDAVTWNFSTGDNTVPVVSTLTPADDAIDVALNQNLVIEFSENVTANAGNITIVNSSTSATFESIGVTSVQVIVSANTVTVNPTIDFAGNTTYHVLIDNDAFHDGAGNAYAGISGTTTWNFITIDQGDITDPTIVSVSPADDATDVLITANLQLTFSENIVVNSGSIIIMEGATEHERIDVTSEQISISSNVVTINPGVNFSSETDYYVLIDNDAFRDVAGNSFAGISSSTAWNFTTILVTDDIDPIILSVSPADDATDVSINSNLQITFSENVVANTGLITIMKGTNTQESIDVLSTNVNIVSNVVTIDPGFDFDGETDYNILIDNGAFHDESGNAFAGISDPTVWNFTTEDVTQPTVAITSSASGTVNGSFDVTITFSELVTGFTEGDVTVGNGTITDFSETTTGTVWTLTIEPVADGDVTVDVNAGIAQDAAGNNNIAAAQFSIVYDSGVGFEDFVPYEISIYSIKNRVIIEFTNEGNYQFTEGIIEVYNLLGQKIVEKNIEKFERFETEVEHVTQIYVVKVIIDGTDFTKRLYIE